MDDLTPKLQQISNDVGDLGTSLISFNQTLHNIDQRFNSDSIAQRVELQAVKGAVAHLHEKSKEFEIKLDKLLDLLNNGETGVIVRIKVIEQKGLQASMSMPNKIAAISAIFAALTFIAMLITSFNRR